jgi:drug/metabolite transporter (DMT)-like permease
VHITAALASIAWRAGCRQNRWTAHFIPFMSALVFPRRRAIIGGTATTGMALGAAAYAAFACHDAAIKFLISGLGHKPLPVWQVLCVRSAFIVGASIAVGRTAMLERAVRTPLKLALLGRAMLTLTAWLLYYSASRALPLAQLLTLYFAAPLITTMLAMPLLNERVPASRWLSVALGFAGVAIACDPGGLAFSGATVAVLVAAACWGVAVILMRQIARRESTALQMFCTNAVFLIATAAATSWRQQWPDWFQVGLLAAVCAAGAFGQFCLFEGARRAPASVMATVEYSALIWAFVLGFLVFGDVPRTPVFVGAGLILSAGAWLLFCERRRAD